MDDSNTNIIKISGKSLYEFFQNLITNDINLLKKQKSIYSCILSPQGKFLNDFFILKKNESFYIEINKIETNNFINLLRKYDLRKKIEIEIKKNLQTFVFLLKDFSKHMSIIKKKYNIDHEVYESFEDPRSRNYLRRVWMRRKTYTKDILLYNDSYKLMIQVERIKRLLPNSQLDLEKNKSFLMNFGFDKINAISFDKGCYIGQENTARQKYRGKQKFNLRLLEVLEGNFPIFNSELKYLHKRIGIMKSYSGNFGLALINNEIDNDKNKIYEIPPMSKVKIIKY